MLVFDNCEHIRDAAADLVEAILAQSATVRILVTSREGLGVADEQLWLVPSLDVGAGIDSAAASLFVERARNVVARFSVANADEAGAVVEICSRLDVGPITLLRHQLRLLPGTRLSGRPTGSSRRTRPLRSPR
jgi:predicted ATPase